jgi:4-hydroxy-2-oxoheptanedioate aldolase
MRSNAVIEKLRRSEFVVGVGLSLGSVRSAEILARAGFDYVMVDAQHGHFDKLLATDAIRAVASTDTVPFARPARNEAGAINDLLDAGALGIVVPMVDGPEEARAAVDASFYHPAGRRSKGSAAAVFYGADYAARANGAVALVVMIETPLAVERCDEILAVPGITACLVGASDLSFAMECPADSPRFLDAAEKVVAAGRRRGVPIGISAAGAEESAAWRRRGVAFVLASHDLALLNQCVRDHARSFQPLRGR